MIIDGKKITGEILATLKSAESFGKLGTRKFLAAILVGQDPASISFLAQKEKTAKELGVDFRLYTLPENITTDELRKEIGRLAGVSPCGGCIVQLPLPKHINRRYVLNAIPKEKDVDVLSEKAQQAFARGNFPVSPPSIAVVEEIITRLKINLGESKVLVIGAGILVGKPIGGWLQEKVKDLSIVDEYSGDYQNQLSNADIIISGVGKPNLFNARELKDSALVIDFGISRTIEGIRGDFNSAGADEKGVLYTPTPGGTGPILVAKLFENFYKLNSD